MRFAQPEALWLLLALPVVALLIALRARAGRRALERALGPAMAERLTAHRWPLAGGLRPALLLVALALLVVGAARPQRGTHYVAAKRMGRDVVIALDLSESMLAEDLKPNRLQRAKHEIAAVLDRLRGDRVSLVGFAGSAFVQCPLTLDYGAARMFLEFMTPQLIPDPGTSLAEALRVSVRAFGPESEGFRALILITDGEDHEGDVEDAAREARAAGVRVFGVGIGSEGGEPIPERDAAGKVAGYKKDREGRVVMSRLDPENLQTIARATGGIYVPAAGTLGLSRVLDEIDRMEKREMEGGIRMLYEERYRYAVWPALVLLLLELWVPWRRPTREMLRRPGLPRGGLRGWLRGARGPALGAIAALGLLASGARAQAPAGGAGPVDPEWRRRVEENEVHRTRHPEDPRPLYNLGTLRQQREEYAEAARLLQDAAGTAEGTLAQRSFYNLGADLFRAGLLREARAAFLEAIRRDPGDEDAKYNLELTQKRLDEMSARQDSSGAAGDSAGGSPSSPQPQPSPGQDGAQPSPGRDPQANRPPGEDRQQPQAGEPEGSQGREGDAPPPSGEGRESERQDSSTGPDRGPRADGALATESLQMAQILRGLENQERELLMQRFRARSRNLRVEKDW